VLETELQSKAKTFHVRRQLLLKPLLSTPSSGAVGFSAAGFEQNSIFTLCMTQQTHLLPSAAPIPPSWPPQ